MKSWKIVTHGAEETIELGKQIGSQLAGGEIIRLIGDVGAGKTTFVRGLVLGIGSNDHVSSPTFTVYKLYSGRIKLYHYDFYRVQNDKMVGHELHEIMDDKNQSVVLEWPEYAAAKLPEKLLDIIIQTINENERSFEVRIPKDSQYIKQL
jgi:tRNA threonylcarbamoyladenosine biosynthesis protein TsaE